MPASWSGTDFSDWDMLSFLDTPWKNAASISSIRASERDGSFEMSSFSPESSRPFLESDMT